MEYLLFEKSILAEHCSTSVGKIHISAALQFICASTGCANKRNPFGKIYYISYCNRFFTKFMAFTEEDSGHVCSRFCYDICYGLKITTILT